MTKVDLLTWVPVDIVVADSKLKTEYLIQKSTEPASE